MSHGRFPRKVQRRPIRLLEAEEGGLWVGGRHYRGEQGRSLQI